MSERADLGMIHLRPGFFVAGLCLSLSAFAEEGAAPTRDEVAAVQACLAQVKAKKGSYTRCLGKAGAVCSGGSADKAGFECKAAEVAVWDQLLDARFKELCDGLPKESAERLRDTQSAWAKYRDLRCSLGETFGDLGDHGRDSWQQGCRIEETARRAMELEAVRDERFKRGARRRSATGQTGPGLPLDGPGHPAADQAAPGGADEVAATLIKLEEARSKGDVAALRSLIKLPLRKFWLDNDGQGDCVVKRRKQLKDPRRAAAALVVNARFVAALRRDKGRAHQGEADCQQAEADSVDYGKGGAAITLTGDKATVQHHVSPCGAGGGSHIYSLQRVGSGWLITDYDDGCHY